MTIQNKLDKLDKEYQKKRNALFQQLTKTWKYCNYQGCNECIRNNGLVPANHHFAGEYGPRDF